MSAEVAAAKVAVAVASDKRGRIAIATILHNHLLCLNGVNLRFAEITHNTHIHNQRQKEQHNY